MVDEFEYLTGLPHVFWSTLADLLTAVDDITLRHSVVDSSLVSMHGLPQA